VFSKVAGEEAMSDTSSARLDWIREVIDQHQGRLIRFAARITGDLDSARDVVQDTFVRLCRENALKTRDHVVPWLFKVCRNRALDVRKKEGPMMPLDDAVGARLEGHTPDPLAALERSALASRVLAVLGELPPQQQEVLRLRFQEDLSYKEISAVTSCSVSNVGFLIHTGVKHLRQRLNAPASPRRGEGGSSHA
jgi:RNA polymerase sigma-70 factor (ECF subfamily)